MARAFATWRKRPAWEVQLSSACPLFTGRFREQLGGRDPHIPGRSGLGAPAAAQLV